MHGFSTVVDQTYRKTSFIFEPFSCNNERRFNNSTVLQYQNAKSSSLKRKADNCYSYPSGIPNDTKILEIVVGHTCNNGRCGRNLCSVKQLSKIPRTLVGIHPNPGPDKLAEAILIVLQSGPLTSNNIVRPIRIKYNMLNGTFKPETWVVLTSKQIHGRLSTMVETGLIQVKFDRQGSKTYFLKDKAPNKDFDLLRVALQKENEDLIRVLSSGEINSELIKGGIEPDPGPPPKKNIPSKKPIKSTKPTKEKQKEKVPAKQALVTKTFLHQELKKLALVDVGVEAKRKRSVVKTTVTTGPKRGIKRRKKVVRKSSLSLEQFKRKINIYLKTLLDPFHVTSVGIPTDGPPTCKISIVTFWELQTDASGNLFCCFGCAPGILNSTPENNPQSLMAIKRQIIKDLMLIIPELTRSDSDKWLADNDYNLKKTYDAFILNHKNLSDRRVFIDGKYETIDRFDYFINNQRKTEVPYFFDIDYAQIKSTQAFNYNTASLIPQSLTYQTTGFEGYFDHFIGCATGVSQTVDVTDLFNVADVTPMSLPNWDDGTPTINNNFMQGVMVSSGVQFDTMAAITDTSGGFTGVYAPRGFIADGDDLSETSAQRLKTFPGVRIIPVNKLTGMTTRYFPLDAIDTTYVTLTGTGINSPPGYTLPGSDPVLGMEEIPANARPGMMFCVLLGAKADATILVVKVDNYEFIPQSNQMSVLSPTDNTKDQLAIDHAFSVVANCPTTFAGSNYNANQNFINSKSVRSSPQQENDKIPTGLYAKLFEKYKDHPKFVEHKKIPGRVSPTHSVVVSEHDLEASKFTRGMRKFGKGMEKGLTMFDKIVSDWRPVIETVAGAMGK